MVRGRADLLLYVPPPGAPLAGAGPLLSFAPLSGSDELHIRIDVQQDGYYDILLHQVLNPRFGSYAFAVGENLLPAPISLRGPQPALANRRWGQVRLRPGRHVLRFRKRAESHVAVHPLAIARLWLEPGSASSYFEEAEWLPVAEGDAERYRPALGARELSGYAEFVFPAAGPGDSVTLLLPAVPEGATHLVVALVGGPARGDAWLELDGTVMAGPVSTYAAAGGRVTRLATLPLNVSTPSTPALTLRCAGKHERSAGYTLGVDGVAYGIDHVFEAEWLVWQGPWSMGRVPFSTGSGRVGDRGYIGADCHDPGRPAETLLDVPWTGTFRLDVRVAQARDQGKLQVQFGAAPLSTVHETRAERMHWPEEWLACGTVELAPGVHSLRVWNRETDPARKRIRIDAFRFVPVP